MWFIVSVIFAIAALFSRNTDFWIVWGLMIIAHNIEWTGLQIKKLKEDADESMGAK